MEGRTLSDAGQRERPCPAPSLPAGLASALPGYAWARDTVGESGGAVYRLTRTDGPGLYVKHGTGAIAGDVIDEMVRLCWLGGFLPVPAVRHFVLDGDAAWLVTTALSGRTAWQWLDADPAAGPMVVDALTDFLLRLHAIPVDACPFDSGHAVRRRLAWARIDAGLVDIDDFGDAHKGWSAVQVGEAMEALLPLPFDRVVTHGDYSLDNLLIDDGVVTGCIDVARVGVADRYQDLAILHDCLGEFDPALQQRLFCRYGIAAPDDDRLRFHLLLDELF